MIRKITAKNFNPYGKIIHYPGKNKKGLKRNLFRVVLSETQKKGWRIAYLIVRDKMVKKLEQHPLSFESFEPVCGKSLLFVSCQKKPKDIKCFNLDRPVILKKGIWHGVVTRTRETDIKLTENSSVKCIYWALGFGLDCKGRKIKGRTT